MSTLIEIVREMQLWRQARDGGWLEGVAYQAKRMTPKRDKAGRFA